MCIVPLSLVLPLALTRYHLLSFFVTRCHSLSQGDIRCTTHCHFCHSLLFVVTGCTSRGHSLLLVITCIITLLTYSLSKTFEAVYIWWNCLVKMQAYHLQIY